MGTPDQFKLIHLGSPHSGPRSPYHMESLQLWPWPLEPIKTYSLWTPSPLTDLFKLLHYVAHTFIGKPAVALRLKTLLISKSTHWPTIQEQYYETSKNAVLKAVCRVGYSSHIKLHNRRIYVTVRDDNVKPPEPPY